MSFLEGSPAHLKTYRLSVIFVAVLVLIFVIFFSLSIGTIQFSFQDFVGLIMGESQGELIDQIIINIRMPRIFTGVFVGMNLAVAGVLLQGVLRNPMASPNIIGVNAGAGLAAVVIMTLLPGKMATVPIAAFIGALLATLLIYWT